MAASVRLGRTVSPKLVLHNKIEFIVLEGGLAVWSVFDKKIDLIKMLEDASKKGLYIGNGSFYKNESFSVNALRMGFTSMNESEMAEALGILRMVVH